MSEVEHENSLRAYDAVLAFLTDDDWYPVKLEGQHTLRTTFGGKNGDCVCYAQIRLEWQQFLFYVIAPVKVPEEKRPLVAEFLTRANYGLRLGNFEMDYEDGEIRYKSSIDFEGVELPSILIRNMIYPSVQTMDRYLGGILKLIYGEADPKQIITEIEMSVKLNETTI